MKVNNYADDYAIKNVSDRIDALRAEMKREGVDIYIVPSTDYHHSEYVGEYFKARQFMTGFTGSAGTAVFTKDKAGLWTDGRYFIQAEKELRGSKVSLYKMGEPGVDTIESFLKKELPKNGVIGFDGQCTGISEGLFMTGSPRKSKAVFAMRMTLWGGCGKTDHLCPKRAPFSWRKDMPGRMYGRNFGASVREWMRNSRTSIFCQVWMILRGF